MNRNHNEILQDDEAFTGLAATSPTIPTINSTITKPAASTMDWAMALI